MLNTFHFPESFSRAEPILSAKFRSLGHDIIEDSVQYAKVKYWLKGIEEKDLPDDSALSWLLYVASRYLNRELAVSKRFCSISVMNLQAPDIRIDEKIAWQDSWKKLEKSCSSGKGNIVIRHALGYSLRDLAEAEHVTLPAMKKRHSRLLRKIRNEKWYLSPEYN